MSQCKGKVAHPTRKAAHAAARRIKGYARVYECPGDHSQTRHWHVTGTRRYFGARIE